MVHADKIMLLNVIRFKGNIAPGLQALYNERITLKICFNSKANNNQRPSGIECHIRSWKTWPDSILLVPLRGIALLENVSSTWSRDLSSCTVGSLSVIFCDALWALFHSNYYDVLKFSVDMKQDPQLLFINVFITCYSASWPFQNQHYLIYLKKHAGSTAVMNWMSCCCWFTPHCVCMWLP